MREIVGLFAILPYITWFLTHKWYKDIATPYNLFTFLYIINIMLPILTYKSKWGKLKKKYLKLFKFD